MSKHNWNNERAFSHYVEATNALSFQILDLKKVDQHTGGRVVNPSVHQQVLTFAVLKVEYFGKIFRKTKPVPWLLTSLRHQYWRFELLVWYQWASYQIRKIAGCACAGKRPPPPPRRLQRKRAVMPVGIANLRWQGKCSRNPRRLRTRNCTYVARGPSWEIIEYANISSCLYTQLCTTRGTFIQTI